MIVRASLHLSLLVLLVPPANAQEESSIKGTLETVSNEERVPVEGVSITVAQDGVVVGTAVSAGDGTWQIVVPGGGVYEVELDVESLPDGVAIFMTLIVIGGCVFFLFRRLKSPEVQYVTSASDYVILAIVAAPFITGFLSYYQWFGYQFFTILHILSGEIMLIAIPFTRLSHMLFSPLTRAYMGSEFGGVRHARDW